MKDGSLCPERDLSRNGIYFKHLELITPERALGEHNLLVEAPVFVHGSGNVEYGNLLYRAGEIIEAPIFSPRKWKGIVFERTRNGALTNSSEVVFRVQEKSWVAFLEAVGSVYTRDESRVIDYRLARAVRIKKIEAHCQCCAEDNFLNIPLDKIDLPYRPLKEGFAFEKYPGNQGILGAVCDIEKHLERRPWIKDLIKYKFQISDNGELTTSKF